MSQIAAIAWARAWRRVWSVTFVVFVTAVLAVSRCTAQALQKGVSVELAVTRYAVAMPDADERGAVIVAVTHGGNVYFGVDRMTPAALAEKQGLSSGVGKKLYIKADARTPYADVAKVLDAVRRAGVTAPNLLTAQDETPEPGKRVLPQGLEVRVGLPLPAGTESTVVQMQNSGRQWPLLKINDEVVPWANLQSGLRQHAQNHPQTVVLLKADGLLPYGDVVHVVDVCRSTMTRVFLVTPAT